MADGNGSIADREDNKSLDAADAGGGPSGSIGGGSSFSYGPYSTPFGAPPSAITNNYQINGVSVGVGPHPDLTIEKVETIIGNVASIFSGENGKKTFEGFKENNNHVQISFDSKTGTYSNIELDSSTGKPKEGSVIDIHIDPNNFETFSTGIPGQYGTPGEVEGYGVASIERKIAHEILHGAFGEWSGYPGGNGHYGKGLFDALIEYENQLMQAYDPWEPTRVGWPVVLDLDGDGLDLVAIDKSKAFYDIDGDGYLENVGWVGDGDGFLSIDLNGDGLINEPKELAFALSTDDPDDTDLEGLAATYDSNQDGVLDSNDADFAKFKVWIDIDQDGSCDAGEVKSLADVGITSVNLKSDNKEEVIAGNKVYGTTSYTKSDGTTGKVGDVGLATSAAGWKKEEVSGGIKFNYEGPPGQPGNPNNPDNAGKAQGQALFEAAAATALIMDVGASGLIGAMGAELDDDLSTSGSGDVILGGGAGNDKIKGGDGNDWLAGGEGIDSISGGDGHDILFVDSEDKIDGGKGFDVAVVTDDKAVTYDLAKIGIEAVAAGAGDDVLNGANLKDTALLDGGKGDDKLIGGKGGDILSGGEGKDAMFGGAGDDLLVVDADDDFKNIDGGSGWDRVVYLGDKDLNLNITDYNVEFFQAGDGNDVIKTDLAIQTDLDGGGGNDTMTGGWAGDFLAGGKGDDRLEGGYGNDTYQFSRGDGHDTVKDMYVHKYQEGSWNLEQESVRMGGGDGNTYVDKWNYRTRDAEIELNAGNDDKIAFGPGIGPEDVLIRQVGNNLEIALKDPANPNADFGSLKDRITIEDWDINNRRVESLAFADGTKLNIQQIMHDATVNANGDKTLDLGAAMQENFVAPEGASDDFIAKAKVQVGTDKADILGGGDKSDILVGGKGGDTLVGGKGDDWLEGGDGSDKLVGGDGKDTVVGGAGNDTVGGGEGDDELIGGAGKDTGYFFGNKADYEINVNDDGSLTVKFIGKDEPAAEGEEPKTPKVNEGTDHLVDIETLRFADGEVKVASLVADAAAAKAAEAADAASPAENLADNPGAKMMLALPPNMLAKSSDLDEDEEDENLDGQNRMKRLPEMSTSGGAVAMAAALGIAATGAATALAAAEVHGTGVASGWGESKAVVPTADVNATSDLALATGAAASAGGGLGEVETGATKAASHLDGAAVIDATAGSTRYLDHDPRPIEDVVYERTMISMGYGPDRFNYDEPSYNDRLTQVGRELFGANWAVGDNDAAAPSLSAGDVVGVEDSWIKLAITVGLTDTDGSEVLLPVRISGVPAGAILSAGKEVAPGVWEVSAGALGNLQIKPAPNSSHDFTLTVQATSFEQESGATSSVNTSCVVEVAATVDQMISLQAQNVAGVSATSGDQVLMGGGVIWGGGGNDVLTGMGGNDVLHGDGTDQTATAQLDLHAIIPDPGDVQGFWVTLSGLPQGATVVPGIDMGNGTWRIGGLDLGNVSVNWPAGKGDLSLNVFATGFDIDPDTGDIPTKDGPQVSFTITASDTTGDDILSGGAGNDSLVSTGGNDHLDGGTNNDTYVVGSADGDTVHAVITNNAVTDAGEDDQLKLLSNVSPEDVWFQKQGADLIVKLLDGSDSTITIQDWYTTDEAKLDSITIDGGETLMRAKVDQLVQDMAMYAAQNGTPDGNTPLTAAMQNAIDDAWEP